MSSMRGAKLFELSILCIGITGLPFLINPEQLYKDFHKK